MCGIGVAVLSMYVVIDYDSNNKPSKDFSIGMINHFDNAQSEGTPYLTATQIPPHQKLSRDHPTIALLDVTMTATKYSGSWAIVKPVVMCQYSTFNEEGLLGTATTNKPCTVENQHKNTIVKSNYVKPLMDTIFLKANQSVVLPVEIQVPEIHLEKFRDTPFEIIVGFELLDSNFEKLPRQINKIEVYYENSPT